MNISALIRKFVPARYFLCLSYYAHKYKGKLEPEMAILRELAGNKQRAIDVGANRGLYTYALSKIFNKVEAFEPVPEYFDALTKSKPGNVSLHNIGLSDKGGVLEINIPKDNYGESPSFIDFGNDSIKKTVPIKLLDEYQFSDVSFIKIDVEGYESFVIRGAEQTIRKDKPVLLVEIEQRHLDRPITDIFNMIIEYGYHGYYYLDGKYVDVSNFSYEKDQKPYLDNLKNKKYINNFIFKPNHN
ncbi:MAG: FkbM family methyltransferase [Desulfuromonadaceae bacterium]